MVRSRSFYFYVDFNLTVDWIDRTFGAFADFFVGRQTCRIMLEISSFGIIFNELYIN